jgi:ElaB/YqjD/DUF883 family membrane-anchored ribosome-binding protein
MSHHKTSESSTSPEELIANIQKLMDEVESIVSHPGEAIANGTGHRLADLQEKLSDMTHRVKGAYKTARRNVVNGAHKTDEAIRSHPYQSIAIGVGIGLVVGALLRGRRSDD